MESAFFGSPVWNSSFEDNDASTTLDTSIETENGSNAHDHEHVGHRKVIASRSSPGAAGTLDKGRPTMLGYFDDVESFFPKPKSAIVDVVEGDLGSLRSERGAVRTRKSTGISLEVMHESDEGAESCHSSPSLHAPSPIQACDFSSNRRSSRSHTSQGIPCHSFSNGLDVVAEDKSVALEAMNNELKIENDKLRNELDATHTRISEMEQQMALMTTRLEEEQEQKPKVSNGDQEEEVTSPLLSAPTANAIMKPAMSPYTMATLLPSGQIHHYLGDAQGHGNPDSASMGGLSMTPDPFSPFQRFSPSFPAHAQMTPNEGGYLDNHAFTPQRLRMMASVDGGPVSSPLAGKGAFESRLERGSRSTNINDSQVPVDVLVAKTLGAKSQDASIALQQQLKSGSPARKAAILEAMAPHVLRLSDDKHGNFLVQRAVGVDPEVAEELKGHFVDLSLSQFGCHVVQRVLDEETLRAFVADELLTDRVFDTLTCRNSIHVWQKILEINWADEATRTKVFTVVNEVMKGRWAETAMQETGSIICQNIFESADVLEKQDCVSEILERLCECAANQWGVWVVQHIIEHGDSTHRKLAFGKLLSDAVALTLSQYGQKAIMSALKSGDAHFVDSYVDILCDREGTATSGSNGAGGSNNNSSSSSSRRSVLVDIASAPQGVQIVTQLLTSVQPAQRERIIKTVRKNSVFLKGSKAGLRVHQLCERARAFTGY